MSHTPEPSARRARPLRESAAMLAGTAVSGLCAYAYIAIGTRAYGDEAMAPIAVLWTFWAVSAALFTFPIQHWAIRTISVDGDTLGVAGTVPRLSAVVLGVAAAMGVAARAADERIFGSTSPWWPLLVFSIALGAGFVGLQRGVLAGKGRYYATAANIAAENLLRVALGIAAIVVWPDDVVAFALVLALGPAVAVFWPEAVRLPVRSGTRQPVLRFLGGLAGGILIAQIVLNSGPLILQGIGAPEVEVTALFLALALFRAPYLLALGLATRLTAPLTELVVRDDRPALRRIVLATTAGTFAAAGIGWAAGYLAGPWVIRLVFAPQTDPAALVVAFISAGSILALGGLGLVLVLVAEHRTAAVQTTWLLGAVSGAVVLAAGPSDPTSRVVAAFVTAECVAVAAMALVLMARAAPAAGTAGRR
ncbi:MAG: hypothetical protein KQH83_09440 [Actinobacteria bacterium]|nr:hypothetical protein [Actinomycetota bacterium]